MSGRHSLHNRYTQLVATFALVSFGLLMTATMQYQVAANLVGTL